MALFSYHAHIDSIFPNYFRWLTISVGRSKSPDIADDPFICPRSETVRELARILDDQRVVLVRGTPTCGKSTLASLLCQYYKKNKIPAVLIDSWPKEDSNKSYYAVIAEQAKDDGYSMPPKSDLPNANMLVVLDEAQMSYYDSGLWLGLIKRHVGARHGLRICLFVSYGSTRGPEAGAFGAGSPLHNIPTQQQVSIVKSDLPDAPPIGIYYTRDEFDDAARRICKSLSLRLDDDAIDYVFSLSNGHPGAVTGIIGMIEKVCLKPLYKDPNLTTYIVLQPCSQAWDDFCNERPDR
jgi:hypothetical protein